MPKQTASKTIATTPNKTHTPAYPIDAFCRNWTKASTVDEVVSFTGLTKSTVSAMSTKLRALGVELKKMPRRLPREIDVEALNKLIREASL